MRYGHSAVMHNSAMWIFGGFECTGRVSDEIFMWSVTDNSWKSVQTEGAIPPRYFHSAAEYGGNMYVVGGLLENGRDVAPLDLVHVYNFQSHKWCSLHLIGNIPSPRWGSAYALDHTGGMFYTFFGMHSGKEKEFLWLLDFKKGVWAAKRARGHPLKFNTHFHAAACIINGNLYITGGQTFADKHPVVNEVMTIYLQSQKSGQVNICDLPDEILPLIFSFLPTAVDIARCGRVCHRWYHIATTTDSLWAQFARENIFMGGLTSRQKVVASALPRALPENVTSLKVTVVGDSAVGKTATITTFTFGRYQEVPMMGIFDVPQKTLQISGHVITLSLWDTNGEPDYDRLRVLSYPRTDIFIVMYSVTSKNSLSTVETKWIPEITSQCPSVPFVLVGNKIDLRSRESLNPDMVTLTEGETVAKKYKVHSTEISATENRNVVQLFEGLVWLVLQNVPHHKQSNCCLQ
eukprot:TRINITY_DN1462_c0_g1_i1.p1 TRINITY_DN1462_c0_g1~~TRINITY_DN1462_c0_g1_i1.p1  ORF type:complete len:462 (-),score=77.16 TRINITY_DN1462_c0_g1_i1:38-1423(-)